LPWQRDGFSRVTDARPNLRAPQARAWAKAAEFKGEISMFNRFRSMPATAMAVVLGCALMATAAPAAAQKKEKQKKEEEAKGKGLTASKGFAPALKKMTDATAAKDAATLQAALAEGQTSATAPDDKYLLGFYQLQLGILNKDQASQSQGLDVMLDSGLTPPENLAVYNFYSGNFAYGAKDYPKAIKRLEAARTAGSTETSLPVLLMDSYLSAGQADQGIAIAKTAIEASRAAGQRPSDELYVRPIKALQAAKRNDEMLALMTARLRDYGQPQVWRQTLFSVLQAAPAGGTPKEQESFTLDTMRLMRAAGAMTERLEYDEYSALAASDGLPGEAVAVIAEGEQKKVFPSTDTKLAARRDDQKARAGNEASTIVAYAKQPSTLANPKTAGATADALVGYGHYADAIPLYQAAAKGAAEKDMWTYRLGVAQALSGDKAGAKASFGQVTGARKRLADLWTVKLDAAAPPPAAAAAAPATN
jgi:tetratricopeptide (TPR) repeat protein